MSEARVELAGSETSLLPGVDIEELRVHDGRLTLHRLLILDGATLPVAPGSP